MEEYVRKYPLFALCGLNCGLCPRFHTDGASKCPGCGGKDFHLKHPSCAVITCNKKHDNVEYCFECSSYPCKKYSSQSDIDSFISYKNVLADFEKAKKEGVLRYQEALNKKIKILERLIANYNDGRRKNFYCLAVNLFDLPVLENIMARIDGEIKTRNADHAEKIQWVAGLFEKAAEERNIELKLRK